MKIIVLMKQVANKDAVLRIAGDEKWINEADVSQQTNESDGYALEEALRTVETKGEGEVVVCTLGPQTAKTVIKDALARGANRAIHIVVEDSKTLSPYQIAKAISDAIREENADLVFTGLQSDDASYGQTGVILAELLGIPHATIVIEVDRASLGETIRYASLKGIMAAKSKEVREVTPSLESFASASKIEKVYMPLKTKQTQILGNGDAKAGAVELVEKLRTEVRVI